MSRTGKLDNKIFLILRWIARIFGSLMALFLVFMVLAYTFGEGEDAPPPSIAAVFAALVIGEILSWKWEGYGGGFLLLSSIVLFVLQPNAFLPPTLLLIFPATAILFLICWLKSRAKPIISEE